VCVAADATCLTTARGKHGQQIALSPVAVVQPISDQLAPLDPLGVIGPVFRTVSSTLPPIVIGTVPSTRSSISGAAIADAVVVQLRGIPVLAPVVEALIGPVRQVLAVTCGVAAEPPSPTPQPGGTVPGAPAPPAQPGGPAPGAPSAGVGTAPGQGPLAGVPLAPGQPAPGVQPGFGVPVPVIPPDGVAYNYGAPPPQIGYTGADLRAATDSQSVGSAQPVYGGQAGPVSRPVMLAVLMLTLVSTQLLRTWAVRRTEKLSGRHPVV
jgi:hypothetical protein